MNTIHIDDISPSSSIHFESKNITAQTIKRHVRHLQNALQNENLRHVGLYLDNCPEWLYVSLATMTTGVSLVPLPVFFTAEQLNHILSITKLDGIIGDNPAQLLALMPEGSITQISERLFLLSRQKSQSLLSAFSGILTFTSGSTGSPKGVLLPYANVTKQLKAIYNHLKPGSPIQYLTLTPLSILLENIIAIDTLLHKGAVHLNPLATLLDLKKFSMNVEKVLDYIAYSDVTTFLLMPLFLEQLLSYLETHNVAFPKSIRFIALGGAMTPIHVLKKAQDLQLPVYQGYGLSESCSIVSMNTQHENRIGSVGKVLPHVQVLINEHHSIFVKGNLFQSYLGEAPNDPNQFYDTGDLGYLDDGYLYITGRKKNILVLQNGRNVSPEWIESEVLQTLSVNHVVVVGDSLPFISIIIDRKPLFCEFTFQKQLEGVNEKLPGFAKIRQYILADEPFTTANHLLTMKHRPNSNAVITLYKERIDAIYQKNKQNCYSDS